jgi:uncharacterized protein (TIGR02246 family)
MVRTPFCKTILCISTLLVVSAFWPSGLAATPGAASQGTGQAGDLAAIQSVLDRQQAAWNRGDVNTFLEGYWRSPELTFSGSSGITRGFAGVQERYRKNYPDKAAMGELRFSELEFRFLGPDAALVLGHWHLTREKGNIGGVFSLVWRKFPDGWKIVHDHTSQVEERK